MWISRRRISHDSVSNRSPVTDENKWRSIVHGRWHQNGIDELESHSKLVTESMRTIEYKSSCDNRVRNDFRWIIETFSVTQINCDRWLLVVQPLNRTLASFPTVLQQKSNISWIQKKNHFAGSGQLVSNVTQKLMQLNYKTQFPTETFSRWIHLIGLASISFTSCHCKTFILLTQKKWWALLEFINLITERMVFRFIL